MFLRILSHLPNARELCRASLVCSGWKAILRENEEELWHALVAARWRTHKALAALGVGWKRQYKLLAAKRAPYIHEDEVACSLSTEFTFMLEVLVGDNMPMCAPMQLVGHRNIFEDNQFATREDMDKMDFGPTLYTNLPDVELMQPKPWRFNGEADEAQPDKLPVALDVPAEFHLFVKRKSDCCVATFLRYSCSSLRTDWKPDIRYDENSQSNVCLSMIPMLTRPSWIFDSWSDEPVKDSLQNDVLWMPATHGIIFDAFYRKPSRGRNSTMRMKHLAAVLRSDCLQWV